MSSFCFVYTTIDSLEKAKNLAAHLVEKKLAACANIIPQMHSIYEWNGAVQKDEEVIILLKSQSALFDQIKSEILKHHSYECPCILTLPIEKGHSDFLEWMQQQTTEQ